VIYLLRSQIDSRWIEIREGQNVLREVEVLFPLRKFPRSFSSLEAALNWLSEIELKLAKAKAYRLLSMRSYPSAMLLEKLEQKGYSRSVSEKVIEALKTLGYLQDDDFWTRLIQREFQRGYGPRYLEWTKGAPAAKIRELITEEMQRKKIRELSKKFSSPQKAAAALARRGFDLNCILAILDLRSGK
jgi:SOS response regulatory protein OraA/RecX